MSFITYVLYSRSSGKHYTGCTSDIGSRLISHNQLGKDWTSRYRPWEVIYTKEFISKEEALKFEKWLKTGAGRDFIKTIPH